MDIDKYKKNLEQCTSDEERRTLNKKFSEEYHRKRIFKNFMNWFLKYLPILDFFLAILGIVIALIK